jgi:CubicO group peptidase (beta-lactamase class C family)
MRKILATALCIFPLICWNAPGQELDEELLAVFEDYQIMGMSVWVLANGETTEFHYGLRDLARNLPVDQATRYRIASISKSFTALGLLKLYDQGQFELDDDISDYLDFDVRNPNFPSQPITFRMLLSHQSSLQDGGGYPAFLQATFGGGTIPTMDDLLLEGGAFFSADLWRTESPGSFFAYSNLNYGLIGTLIEAISGQRFDAFMRTQILEPLNSAASYNIQDLADIDNLSVLYRYNGSWQPQFDHYKGSMPEPIDLQGYVIGTNGLIFSPQGGLRATAAEVGRLLVLLESNDAADLNISEGTLEEMKSVQWTYNGSNGDNYFGLFNSWGLGLHLANDSAADGICDPSAERPFIGHPGEAYGLVSDAYVRPDRSAGLVLLINGKQQAYQSGNNSAFYQVEEAVFSAVCDFWSSTLGAGGNESIPIQLFPNPAKEEVFLRGIHGRFSYGLFDLNGRILLGDKARGNGQFRIDIPELTTGLYILEIRSDTGSKTFKLQITP